VTRMPRSCSDQLASAAGRPWHDRQGNPGACRMIPAASNATPSEFGGTTIVPGSAAVLVANRDRPLEAHDVAQLAQQGCHWVVMRIVDRSAITWPVRCSEEYALLLSARTVGGSLLPAIPSVRPRDLAAAAVSTAAGRAEGSVRGRRS